MPSFSAAHFLASVVLPTCRGPSSTTAGKLLSSSVNRDNMRLAITMQNYHYDV